MASYFLALLVPAAGLVLIGFCIWLIMDFRTIPAIILGVFGLLIAVELRPRVPSYRKLKKFARGRDDAPALFALLDQIAAEVGARPAYAVVARPDWNAGYGAYGWRRRRVVFLGLPLWEALTADQKVAILGHEFGHGVNGDSRHGVVVGTSIESLSRLHLALLPGRRRISVAGIAGIAEALTPPLMWVLRQPIALLIQLQAIVSLREGQRAEYLADATGARLASPTSLANALDVLVTGSSTYSWVIKRRLFNAAKAPIWDQFRAAHAAVPDSELERRRRERALQRFQLTDTHPPMHLRIKVLAGLPAAQPRVTLSADQETQIRAELAQDYTRIAAAIDKSIGVRRGR